MNNELQDGLVITASPLPVGHCRKLLRRALHRSGFKILAQVEPLTGAAKRQNADCTLLVVWSPFFAYQALQMGTEAGFMLPFWLILQGGEAWSRIVSFDYRRMATTGAAAGSRVLARVLEFQLGQILAQIASPDNYQNVVAEGGGEYRGVQLGSGRRHIPDLVLFDDPATHTTLALPLGKTAITASAVRKRIARSRLRFRQHGETPGMTGIESQNSAQAACGS